MSKNDLTPAEVILLISYLSDSLTSLRSGIAETRALIEHRDGKNASTVLDRLNEYDKIVDQQQDFLPTIVSKIESGDQNEATLAITRVKALGEFLLEDLQELVTTGSNRAKVDKTGLH